MQKTLLIDYFPFISLYFIMHIVMQLHPYLVHTLKPGNPHPLCHSILLSAGAQRQMFLQVCTLCLR